LIWVVAGLSGSLERFVFLCFVLPGKAVVTGWMHFLDPKVFRCWASKLKERSSVAGMGAYDRVETTGVHGATVAQNGRSGKRRVTVEPTLSANLLVYFF
jgi:hypothetical protein